MYRLSCFAKGFWPLILVASLSACSAGGSGGSNGELGGDDLSLSLSVSPSQVQSGETAHLVWMSNAADSCEASGDWSGAKPSYGEADVGPLTADSEFLLQCERGSAVVSRRVTVRVIAISGDGVTGKVDSSLINQDGGNAVYLFSGAVTPDDIDGDAGDPLAVVAVTQIRGSCEWSYALGELPTGTYTLAFTRYADSDLPGANNDLHFYGAAQVEVVSGLAEHDFVPSLVLRVGPGRALSKPSAAAAVATNGAVIEIDAGDYVGDVASWYADNLTLRGVGGYAHLRANGASAQGKGIWVIAGDNARVEHIEFSEASVAAKNGAGIRQEGLNLTVCKGYFHDNENGILGGGGNVLIEYSEFDNNGYGDGYSHNMYIAGTERFTLRYSYSHHARIGHNVKTRAKENFILYNRITDEATGTGSYNIDISEGGLSYIIGNLLHQGPNSDNSVLVAYGAEGLAGERSQRLYVINNTFVNNYGSGVFVTIQTGVTEARIINNLFVGNGTLITGISTQATNLRTASSGLVDADNFDYRLTASSAARNAGSNPGLSATGFSLSPVLEYEHPADVSARTSDGVIDIGAYEYQP